MESDSLVNGDSARWRARRLNVQSEVDELSSYDTANRISER